MSPHVELESGSTHNGNIVSIQDYGIICSIVNCDQVGFIHVNVLPDDYDEKYKLGDDIEFEILGFKPKHNKYNLRLKSK